MKSTYTASLCAVLTACLCVTTSCSSSPSSSQSQSSVAPTQVNGTLTIDANVSAGTRFNVYSNSLPNPQTQPLVPGTWHPYQFSVGTPLTMLRLDPTEASGATILIRSMTVNLPGQGNKTIPLSLLPKFLKNNATVTYDPARNVVEIHSTGPGMDIMNSVDPSTFTAA